MDREALESRFPKLLSKIGEEIDELRYLTVVDPNEYDPEIDDNFDDIDPADYNYMVYLTELVQQAVGEELFERLPELLEKEAGFEDFLESEPDLYGIKSSEDETEVACRILDVIERHLG